MIIKINSKLFDIGEVKTCKSFFQKARGLIFTRKEKVKTLLFKFDKERIISIHSLFVFFPFVAIWLDDKNNVIEKRIVKPFRLSVMPKKPFSRLIEIPINRKYLKIIKDIHHRRVLHKV
jgi:uncharacterized membrane protein (UPF0127 family)